MEIKVNGKDLRIAPIFIGGKWITIKVDGTCAMEMQVKKANLHLVENEDEVVVEPYEYIFTNNVGTTFKYATDAFTAYANVEDCHNDKPLIPNEKDYKHFMSVRNNCRTLERVFFRYYVKDGKIEQLFLPNISKSISYSEDYISPCNIKIEVNNEEYGYLYYTIDDAKNYDRLYHKDANGNEVIDNPNNLRALLLNEEQKAIKAEIEALLEKAKAHNMQFYYNTDDSTIVCLNKSKDAFLGYSPEDVYESVKRSDYESCTPTFLKESYLKEDFKGYYCDDTAWVKKSTTNES